MKRLAKTLSSPAPPSITTPDKVESRIRTLEFTDGMPSQETLDKTWHRARSSWSHELAPARNGISGAQCVAADAELAGCACCQIGSSP